MKYYSVTKAKFIDRPNRFTAHVRMNVGDREEILTVHVKNTGRCRELLLPDAEVYLAKAENPARKTAYDLIAVRKDGLGIVNIDSMAPNAAAGEWFAGQGYDLVKPEYTYGNSRIDFYMEKRAGKNAELSAETGSEGSAAAVGDSKVIRYLCEVKGCTLEREGVGYFPDAPTERGVKHLRELIHAASEGYKAGIAFVIPMEGVMKVLPNMETHPAFGRALAEAEAAGVEILYLPCHVAADSVQIYTQIRGTVRGCL